MTSPGKQVFCYGASGHGRVVADILRTSGVELLGFVDDDPAKVGTRVGDVPVVSPQELVHLRLAQAIVTIGCNRTRLEKAKELQRRGFGLATAIHPAAVVAGGVPLGEGSVVMAGAIINAGSRIGKNTIVNTAATVDHDGVLADGAHISPGASLAGGVRVGERAHIGIRASIIQDITVGEDSIVGAGAVVIRDVPKGVTVVGNPARILTARRGMSAAKSRVFVSPELSIRETLQAIDGSGLAIALVVDAQQHLLGTVTDGDVRRAILQGRNMNLPVTAIMTHAPLTVTPTQDVEAIRDMLLRSTLKHVPVVDSDNCVLDLITVAELLSRQPQSQTDSGRSTSLPTLRSIGTSGRGALVAFEEKMAACAGRRYAVAVNSGSSGLHLLIRALGLGYGDEVITSAYGAVATAHCLLRENATPVFADIDPRNFRVKPEMVEAAITSRTRAILAVDLFGQPEDYDTLEEIAGRRGLRLLIDASQSVGAEYKSRRAGSHGAAAVFSFSAGSVIATGEGGAVVTDDARIAGLCRSMREQGEAIEDREAGCERLGYGYRLAEMNSLVGIAELERLDELLECRQRIADDYERLLEGWPAVERPLRLPGTTRSAWHRYPLRWKETPPESCVRALRARGLGARECVIPLQGLYRKRFGFHAGQFPSAEAAQVLTLPIENHFQRKDVCAVVDQLREILAAALEPVKEILTFRRTNDSKWQPNSQFCSL